MPSGPNEQLVMDFFGLWVKKDLDAIVAAFAEDGVYHNVPMDRIQGHEAIRETVAGWLEHLGDISFRFGEVIAAGDKVMVEHFDQVPTEWGVRELPVLGFFELRDGKIALWREYFDLAQMAALQAPPA